MKKNGSGAASKKTLAECKSSVMFNYSVQHLRCAEKWVSEELGYEYSLNKSKKLSDPSQRCENPLLNGSLMGSILMRLKIGKALIIKNPINKQQIEKNWNEVNKICFLRQYESLRKQSLITEHIYETYLGLIGDLKNQHSKAKPTSNTSLEADKCNRCDHILMKKVDPTDDHLNSQRKQLK